MINLEDIINNLIRIDINALNKIKQIKEKENNIENYIFEKLKKEKDKIDAMYLYKKNIVQEKYDKMYETRKTKLDEQKQNAIREIQAKYLNTESNILENLLKSIIN